MYYLMWRVLIGLHDEIKIFFLPVGHTKFAPDWYFGLMKQQYRRTKVGDLDDIANCVSRSSVPQLMGSLHGSVFVPMCNWSRFFGGFHYQNCLKKGITQMHHFCFTVDAP